MKGIKTILRQEWEYRVISWDAYPGEDYLETEFNKLGAEGWQLVSVSHSLRTYIFKRPK